MPVPRDPAAGRRPFPVDVRRLHELPTAALGTLVAESAAAGYRMLERLRREWDDGRTRFDGPGEALLGVYDGPTLIAVGGLTADSYGGPNGGDPRVGRLRHVYVRAASRRRGVGRALVRALEVRAAGRFDALVLRTDTAAAAAFYEALGYRRLPAGGTATHRRSLGGTRDGGGPAR